MRKSPLVLVIAALGCGDPDSVDVLEPRDTHELQFLDPETCRECHPDHVADWEGSMHAYSAIDPVFHAANAVMTIDFAGETGQFCTQCHTVPGFLGGETRVSIDDDGIATQITEGLSTVAQAGVSCTVCHLAVRVLEPQNARLEFSTDGVIRGPFADAVENEAHESIESPLHRSGELCTACHNVIIPLVEPLALESTGTEWEEYLAGGGTEECQDCHMPERQGQAAVDGPMRTIHAHTFVGVDVALIDDFPDQARQRMLVQQMLESAAELTVELTMDAGPVDGFTATIENLAGHSLPSGATSERRMWLEATLLLDGNGTPVYETGMLDANGDLMTGIEEHSVTPDGDPDLWWFGTVLHSDTFANGMSDIVAFPHRAETHDEFLIEPLASEARTFDFPALAPGDYELQIRLLFRSFQPFFMKALEDHPIVDFDPAVSARVPTFAMETTTLDFTISP